MTVEAINTQLHVLLMGLLARGEPHVVSRCMDAVSAPYSKFLHRLAFLVRLRRICGFCGVRSRARHDSLPHGRATSPWKPSQPEFQVTQKWDRKTAFFELSDPHER